MNQRKLDKHSAETIIFTIFLIVNRRLNMQTLENHKVYADFVIVIGRMLKKKAASPRNAERPQQLKYFTSFRIWQT